MAGELDLWRQQMEENIMAAMKGVSGVGVVIQNMNEKIRKMETSLRTRVYISSVHANMIKREVGKRVRYIIEIYKLNYREDSKKLYSSMYRSIHDKYSIADYREIPDVEFDNAMEFIRYWDNQLLVTQLGQKAKTA